MQRQEAVPLVYETVQLECGFRADLIVNHQVVVEIKCKEVLQLPDEAQLLLYYLCLLDLRIGLLRNFRAVILKQGIKRMVNNYQDPHEDRRMLDLSEVSR